MAITLNMNIAFDLRVVITTDEVEQIRQERVKALEMSDEAFAALKGTKRFGAEVMRRDPAEFSDEECFKILFKSAMRSGLRDLLKKDLGDCARVGPAQLTYIDTGKARKAAEKPLTECPDCVVTQRSTSLGECFQCRAAKEA